MPKYNFISGLPRSGSTLLSAILNQNPRFTASISDPLLGYVDGIRVASENAVGVGSLVNNDRRLHIMRGIFDSFYDDDSEVCFNTNRGWAGSTSLLKALYPDFKMIVCVREIPWILDSFEVLESKNPLTIKPLYHHQSLNTVYDRCEMLMGNLGYVGYVGEPLKSIKQSITCAERDQILYVEYDALAKHPQEAMDVIYNFIDEPEFQHDFDDVEVSFDEFDESAKIEGLHTTRSTVQFIPRNFLIPNDIVTKYSGSSFWKMRGFSSDNLNWVKAAEEPQKSKNFFNKKL